MDDSHKIRHVWAQREKSFQTSNRVGALGDSDYSVTGDIQEEPRYEDKEEFEDSGAFQDSSFSEYL